MAQFATDCWNQVAQPGVLPTPDRDGWATVSWDQMVQANENACEMTNMAFIDRSQKEIDAWIDLMEETKHDPDTHATMDKQLCGKSFYKVISFRYNKIPRDIMAQIIGRNGCYFKFMSEKYNAYIWSERNLKCVQILCADECQMKKLIKELKDHMWKILTGGWIKTAYSWNKVPYPYSSRMDCIDYERNKLNEDVRYYGVQRWINEKLYILNDNFQEASDMARTATLLDNIVVDGAVW